MQGKSFAYTVIYQFSPSVSPWNRTTKVLYLWMGLREDSGAKNGEHDCLSSNCQRFSEFFNRCLCNNRHLMLFYETQPCAPVWWWSRSPGNAGPCGAQPRGKRNVEIERILQSFWDFPHFWIWSSELPNSLQRISLRLFQTFCQKNFNITKHSQGFQATKRCPRTNKSPQRLSSSQKTRTSLRGIWTSLRTSLRGRCSSCFSREQV